MNLLSEIKVIWITGLSQAGKTTLAKALSEKLNEIGEKTYILDGDILRRDLCKDLGFSKQDRDENLRRAVSVAKILSDFNLIVIASFITPFKDQRKIIRENFKNNEYLEIFLDTPLSECITRDSKGLYKKAMNGEIDDFTGITQEFEKPIDSEIILNGINKIEDLVQQIWNYLIEEVKFDFVI